MSEIKELLQRAKRAARVLAVADEDTRNAALDAIAEAIADRRGAILEANAEDMANASAISSALQDRLRLDEGRVDQMVRAVREVRSLPDPLAEQRELGHGRSGIRVTKRRIPLGVVAIVYEARPNVTAECAALTVKSGNVVVLRGGKEARASNRAIAEAVRGGLAQAGLPADAALPVTNPDREAVAELLGATGQVDLVIPRGGAGLMAMVDAHARVPVIRHGQGICQMYVDESADLEMAEAIAINAKTHRPGVCNAMETLLVHQAIAEPLLARLGPKLASQGVQLRADARASEVLTAHSAPAQQATAADWDTEFLGLVLAVRTVDDLDEALDHIAEHGTHHTAAIVSKDEAQAERFLRSVDASCVLWNASTRFNDGGELGLGAEMGISTSKMHAYGPMSVTELTAEKLVVYGTGQVR